jgi:hypothetical protein
LAGFVWRIDVQILVIDLMAWEGAEGLILLGLRVGMGK